MPGFGLCERWISVANPKQAVASYDLENLGVLKTEPYLAIAYENLSVWSKRVGPMCTRLLRFDGEQTLPGNADSPRSAGGLLVNAMNVDPQRNPNSTSGMTTSTFRRSPLFRAFWPRAGSRTRRAPIGIWRCIT